LLAFVIAEEVPHSVRRNLASDELLALDVVSLAVLVRDGIDAAVVCAADHLGIVAEPAEHLGHPFFSWRETCP
jgi:uncharacterized protein (DUF362 family)